MVHFRDSLFNGLRRNRAIGIKIAWRIWQRNRTEQLLRNGVDILQRDVAGWEKRVVRRAGREGCPALTHQRNWRAGGGTCDGREEPVALVLGKYRRQNIIGYALSLARASPLI